MNNLGINTLSATTLAKKIKDRSLTARAVVDAHIARIEATNPQLNAVVWTRFDAARREADAVDQAIARGEPVGPLAGVPITVKECLDLEGSPSTFGVAALKDHRATRDELHVRRLRDAGAIVLGKTNVAQLLIFLETDNPVYGKTLHPTRADRSCGGSSGGQAAIIAAGGSPFGLGTDIGGSSRVPAAFCGIVGYKPTPGLMPDLGRGSFPVGQTAIASQVGVLARDVDDVEAVLRISAAQPIGARVDPASLRVGFFDDDGQLTPCPAARRAVRQAADKLGRLGAKVRRWTPPDARETEHLFYSVLGADGLESMGRVLGKGPRDPRVKQLEDAQKLPRSLVNLMLTLTQRQATKAIVRNFGPYTAFHYFESVTRLMDFRERVAAAMADFDVVLSPGTALPAVTHGATAELNTLGTYTYLYNVLGWPAGVVPFTTVGAGEESDRAASRDPRDITARACEQGSAGLPIGVQAAALPGRDHLVLSVLGALQ